HSKRPNRDNAESVRRSAPAPVHVPHPLRVLRRTWVRGLLAVDLPLGVASVLARAAVRLVEAVASGDGVVAAQPADPVVAATAVDRVVALRPDDDVVPLRPRDLPVPGVGVLVA